MKALRERGGTMGKQWRVVVVVIVLVGAWVAACARPAEPEVSLEAARAALEAGDFTQARQDLLAYVERHPDDAEAHFLLGVASFNLAAFGDARTAFERSLELDPERAAAVHHNLGVLAYQVGDLEAAVASFEAALASDPTDPDSHYQLGATYLLMAYPLGAMWPDEALLSQGQAQFEQALALQPGKPEAMVGMANVHLLRDELPEAAALLEQVVEAHPGMREALFALGRVYALQGEAARATETLTLFLESGPPEVWAEQARELLTLLQE